MSRLPRVRILSTGSEILHGLYPDTNSQKLSQYLLEAGFRVVGHAAAPDDRQLIQNALRCAVEDADLVITTGGLGPTEDDITRDIISDVYGIPLRLDRQAELMMRARFDRRGIPMPSRNIVQAMLPEGCVPIYNYQGTAPGFYIPKSPGMPGLLALPGVPREWPPMLLHAIETELSALFDGGKAPLRTVHTLHIAMLPESTVNEAVSDLFRSDPRMEVTILASVGYIRLRLIAEGDDEAEVRDRIHLLRAAMMDRLGPECVFGEGPTLLSLAEVVVPLMAEKKAKLSLAESCTGGAVAKAITDIPGSSEVLLAGYVTYSNTAKVRDLGVDEAVLAREGAVSEAVALAMAEGARRRAGSDYAIAITGIAGPGGGTDEKPVGTVWFAVADADGSEARLHCFTGDRSHVRELSLRQALDLVRRRVLGMPLEARLPIARA